MRQYEKTITSKTRVQTQLNRGLKEVHIGDGVWLIGRQKVISGKGWHCVIYGPNRRTEHHLWGKDVEWLTESNEWDNDSGTFRPNRNGNLAIESKLKIFILTSILDDRDMWCFDLKKTPQPGKLKVIFSNGTVKNIDFDGTFRPAELVSKRFTWEMNNRYNVCPHSVLKFVGPVAYRRVYNQSL
jgi:hypothetical protein